jgi:putative glutamine amidotransferase
MSHERIPLIGIPCDHRMIGPHPFHAVGEKYIVAIRDGAGALPVLIPVLEKPLEFEALFAHLDGVMLTGSPSNVAPQYYAGARQREGVALDERRDATTLPLISRFVASGMPVIAFCRGFQELNVAYGGTLYQHVEEVPGRMDHREDKHAPLEVQYAPVHDVTLTQGGMLHKIAGKDTLRVNSLHGQGVDRLGDGLMVEAVAPDGQIEGVSVKQASGFALGVQWHPEWRFWEDAFSAKLFAEFGEAARAYARGRGQARRAS